VSDDLTQKVRDWIGADPDELTRLELNDLLIRGDTQELRRRFDSPLRFGTAGLRGPLRAGPSGMNQLTVQRVTRAVAAWILSHGAEYAARGVVVGRDARHGSEQFFSVVVSTLRQAGLAVFAFERPLPTPLVSFSVRHFSAAAGIMITASHNPASDNGYKLYDESGAQIIPPTDAIIEQLCSEMSLGSPTLPESGSLQVLGDTLVATYLREIVSPYRAAEPSGLRIAYSAMHGVGASTALLALREAGFLDVTSLASQNSPDADFPTLPFPNPEEPGAMNLVLDLAEEIRADLVLVNDPDADRLGVATRDRGEWRALSGDEVGWLLADAMMTRGVSADDVFATTIVSSSLLSKMVARTDANYVETLTGFKWIARAAPAGAGSLTFGYEEALGYAVNSCVADKDGISAAVALARRAQELSEVQRSLSDRLDELSCLYGPHLTHHVSLRVEGDQAIERMNVALHQWISAAPSELGGLSISECIDLESGYRGLPPTSGLLVRLAAVGRVVLRPSGTESKLKIYVEVCGDPVEPSLLDAERVRTRNLLTAVATDVTERLNL
jgi:phosphomannomutase